MKEITPPILHKNLELARDVASQFAVGVPGPYFENQSIDDLLCAGDEDEIVYLRGDNLSTIINTLNTVVILASAPVPIRRTKSSEKRWIRVAHQRQDILLAARVALALLDVTPPSKSGMSYTTTAAEQRD